MSNVRRAVPIFCMVAGFITTGPASAQTDADARVERLAAQVRDLSAQLAASQRQVDRLEAERDDLLARLKVADQTITALRRGGGPPPPLAAPIPEDPFASPASLLAELSRRYAREVATLPGAVAADPAAREQHRREVARWCEQTARQVRGRGVWAIRLTEPRPTDDPDLASYLVTVIDEKSLLPVGDPFRTDIPRRVVQRAERERRARRPDDAPWRATVTLSAAPRFNADRVEPGPYNIPPFLGLYAEFGFSVGWQSLTPLDQAAPPPGGK